MQDRIEHFRLHPKRKVNSCVGMCLKANMPLLLLEAEASSYDGLGLTWLIFPEGGTTDCQIGHLLEGKGKLLRFTMQCGIVCLQLCAALENLQF